MGTKLAWMSRGLRTMFFGWWIVLAAVVMQLLHGALLLQAFGTYMVVWKDEFGWSVAWLAAAYAGIQIVVGLIAPAQGWFLLRFGTRRVIAVGVVLFASGLIALSYANSFAAFGASLLAVSFGVAFSGFLPLCAVVVNWFALRRATAIALMQTGIGLGGMLVPLVAWLIVNYGWRPTTLASGVLFMLLGIPLSAVFRARPEDYGMMPDGSSRATQSIPEIPSRVPVTARAALKTRAFWLLSLGHSMGVTIVSALLVHAVVYLEDGLGYSLQQASMIVALMTGLTVLGQVAGGVVGDRYDKRVLAIVAMCGHALAIVLLIGGMVIPFAIVQGLALGVRGPQMQSLRADYFGRAAFATIMGVSGLFIMAGQIAGPLLVGIVVDSTANYNLAFWLLVGLAFVGALAFSLARDPNLISEPR